MKLWSLLAGLSIPLAPAPLLLLVLLGGSKAALGPEPVRWVWSGAVTESSAVVKAKVDRGETRTGSFSTA